MILTRALTKRYGTVTAVRSVDLDVREGDRYGLLGPNGSGKTTLVRMLLGLVYATSGEIEVLGRPIPRHAREVLPQIGALIEEPAAYPHLSGRANLALLDAAALALVLPVFLPVAVAVVAGDSIAGEATGGTLRYLLVRPVGRTRLLVAKLVSVIVYVLLAVLAVTFTAYATGVFLLGPSEAAAVGQPPGGGVVAGAGGGAAGGGLAGQAPTAGQAAGRAVTSLSGAPLSLLQLAERIAGAIAFITVSMLGVAAIALFLSTITDSALGAALGALAALVASEVLVTLNAATVVQPYLPTRYWLAWIDFFRQPVFWRDIQRGFGIQAVYVVVLLAAAWANFSTKDITA